MAVHSGAGFETQIWEAKRALAAQLRSLEGKWVVIDVPAKKVIFTSDSLTAAADFLSNKRGERSKGFYLERVGHPAVVAF